MADYQSEYRVFVLERPMHLFRAVVDPGQIENDFRSNHERGRSPHPTDLRATVLHMAVSLFEDPTVVRRLAKRAPERLGRHVATLDPAPGFGVCVADTSGPGHWSVWARPDQLREFVTEVHGIWRPSGSANPAVRSRAFLMTYSMLESGNLVVSYDDGDAARAALTRIAAETPDATECLLLVAFDDDGQLVAEVAPPRPMHA